ncbi:hypothetical protein PJ311_00525 [Bacillus sp. CLL-7-23]|uniref:DUF4234 domain-containing protein n=1 Tax=Bacillus changyiensis TaxID=3004103 RepID=A0ABT4WYT0_9BACI|nr:hypothetical protein [Bacillus changyiensis]MDA7025088.1 hypothetical protein [Bacillus changyiensis]
MSNDSTLTMKSLSIKSVQNVFLLCLVTLGAYIPYWFISRKKSLDMLPYHDIPYAILKAIIGYYLFSFPMGLTATFIFSDIHYSIYILLHRVIMILSVGVLIYCALIVTASLNKLSGYHLEKGSVFAFLLNILYIQHRINKLSQQKREYLTIVSSS